MALARKLIPIIVIASLGALGSTVASAHGHGGHGGGMVTEAVMGTEGVTVTSVATVMAMAGVTRRFIMGTATSGVSSTSTVS